MGLSSLSHSSLCQPAIHLTSIVAQHQALKPSTDGLKDIRSTVTKPRGLSIKTNTLLVPSAFLPWAKWLVSALFLLRNPRFVSECSNHCQQLPLSKDHFWQLAQQPWTTQLLPGSSSLHSPASIPFRFLQTVHMHKCVCARTHTYTHTHTPLPQ